jgi:N4-gp56 family major capsid protein
MLLQEGAKMNRNRKLMNLQLMSPQMNTTSSEGMSAEMKTYYDMELLRNAKPNLVHDQFAQKRNIPKNHGKTIEFRKFGSLQKALTPLTEGVTPDGSLMDVTAITATVAQYGDYIKITDIVKLTTIDNTLVEAVTMLGEQSGKTLDTITRDAINAGTNVIYAGGRASRANLTSNDKLTVQLVKKAATQLKRHNTPKINGSYVGIIHPDVAYDLTEDERFEKWHVYAKPDELYEGEIGRIFGVRFVESTEAKVWRDETCPVLSEAVPASGTTPAQDATYKAVFSTLIVGLNAYATTNVEGGGLETIIKPLGAGDDPLNQRATAGWKAIKTAKILNDTFMVRIESLSDYSEIEEAN